MLRKKVQTTLLATAAVITCVFSGMNADTLTPVKAKAGSGDYSTVYRLYNPNSGEHFYTLSEAEKNHLSVIGWSYEGVGWYAPNSGNSIYRVYNPNNGDHHYTNNIGEKNALVSAGWNDEGIAWYEPETHGKEARHIGAPISGVEFQLNNNEGTVPIWRAYNPNCTGAGSHNYTSNAAEQRQLGIMGWQLEQVGWYGCDPEPSNEQNDQESIESEITERPVYSDDTLSPSGKVSITELKSEKKRATLTETNGVKPYAEYWFEQTINGDISNNPGLAYSLTISDATEFSSDSYIPEGYDMDELIEWGKYAGFNTDILKEQGYTGKGAVIAYVDQPIGDHKQFDTINLHYKNNTECTSSMHGPAVLSLLAGTDIGTAPDAEVYYYAHASWLADQNTHAECLYQIIEQNKSLPDDKKIKMIGFSDNIDDREANAESLKQAVKACEDAGIMVWFCGEYATLKFLPLSDKDDFSNVVADNWWNGNDKPKLVFVPSAGRTTAANEQGSEYIYWAQGGLSWTMPYILGLYADALAIDKTLTQDDLRKLIVDTSYINSTGQNIVYPVNFIATVLERVGRTQDAINLRNAEKEDKKYIYAVLNSNQISSSDMSAIKEFLSNITNAKVLLADTKGADAKDIYVTLKADAKKRGGIVKGVQIFGTNSMVPAFTASYKVQMVNNEIDEAGTMQTDLFYGNFRNAVNDITDYSAYDHLNNNKDIALSPDWPVARLPLSSGEYNGFFEKYDDFALSTGLKQREIVNFSNPIFANDYHIDDMGTFLKRADTEFGILKVPYRLYGNLKGDYPVQNTVTGGFEAANLSAENKKGTYEFIINSHGQWNNVDNAFFTDGKENRESFVNMDTINTVMNGNPYYFDMWTCNNGWNMENNLTTKALSGKCVGMFSATHIISNNGVNCFASLSDMKKSNFYYFYYSYLKALNKGKSRSEAFCKAQKDYANVLLEDSKEPLRGEGNVQFNICNLLVYNNFGVLEPNAAAMSITD